MPAKDVIDIAEERRRAKATRSQLTTGSASLSKREKPSVSAGLNPSRTSPTFWEQTILGLRHGKLLAGTESYGRRRRLYTEGGLFEKRVLSACLKPPQDRRPLGHRRKNKRVVRHSLETPLDIIQYSLEHNEIMLNFA